MRAIGHWEFAEYMLSAVLPSCTEAERTAFRFGSVEPDLNCTTYLKGILHGNGVHGHNYEQVLPRIERLLQALSDREEIRVLDWYRLGKLTHFVADAFTYPHNGCFPGDLRAHMKYEHQLAVRFRWTLCSTAEAQTLPTDCAGLFDWIKQQHERYLHGPMGAENDCRLILSTVCAVVAALTADVLPLDAPAQLMGDVSL